MVIKKSQAKHLLALLGNEKLGIDVSKMNETGLEELEMAGLVHFPTPAFASLTYAGEMVARALQNLIEKGAVDDVQKWDEGFRWIGSEILAMMENAKRSGNVSPLAEAPLSKRGLCHKVHDKERKTDLLQLTPEAQAVLDAFEMVEPDLKIDGELAHLILTSPMGPTEAVHMPFSDAQKERLEAMRVLAYSVPNGDIAALTGIGKAVRNVLENGAAATEGDVIDPLIMDLLADHFDGVEIPAEGKTQLEMLGYIDDAGELLPAGEALLALRALLKNPVDKRLFSLAITREMIDTLETVDKLGEADVDAIKKEMVDKKVKEFNELKEKYGRKLNEMPIKKRQILEKFLEAKEHMKWFEENFDIREYIGALEAFDMVEEGENEKGKAVVYVSETGKKVLEEMTNDDTPVSSQALKCAKLSKRPFEVPNREWVMTGREEKILGEYGVGPRGEFFVKISETIERKPFMTHYEMEVFKRIPSRGMTLQELLNDAKDEHDRHMMEAAVDMLEARGLLEVLSDGHLVETEAGELMDRALSGVPDGFGFPITPVVYRVIKAVAEVGTLYEKEKKIRILPKHHKEAYRRSGLSADAFEKAWVAAREAKYLGKNGVNEAGIDLLRAVEAMNA